MWLTELRTSADATVSLLGDDGRPLQWVVIVGRNGAGKSRLLHGLRARHAGVRGGRTLHLGQHRAAGVTRVTHRRINTLRTRVCTARARIPELVLLDDAELNLDVHAQRALRGELTRTFPETQFIVTTMSPFIVHAAGRGEIFKLEGRRTRSSTLLRFPVEPARLSLEELVASPIFELDSARPPHAAAREDESPRGRLLRELEAHLAELRRAP